MKIMGATVRFSQVCQQNAVKQIILLKTVCFCIILIYSFNLCPYSQMFKGVEMSNLVSQSECWRLGYRNPQRQGLCGR